MEEDLSKFQKNGINKLVILINSQSSDDYIQILTQNYEVVVFNSLTKESLEKVLIAINKVEFSSELKNGQPSVKQSIEETDIKKNKKCGIF